ncbi:MAG: hypothetical protein JRH11_20180 [Deltaproteobacteria bacterium]|nr:hypothetical protein [Deltaproteobacteria bacterium]
MAHRSAVAFLSLAAVLLMAAAPSSASACCADILRKTPVGWTTEGTLLIRAYESSECEGRSTAEIHSPGNFTPDSRFDLYDEGRRLRARDEALLVNPWELESESESVDDDDVDLDVMPARLTQRFAEPVRGLCASDLYVQATPTPGEPADISPWDSTVRVTVSVMTDDGFTEVARDLEVHRMNGHEYSFSVLPSPDGVHAVLGLHLENSDEVGDELRWVRLPENMTSSLSAQAGCTTGALAVPSTTVVAGPDPEESTFLLEDAVRWHADDAYSGGTAIPPSLLGAILWNAPSNAAFRGYVVEALEEAGYDAVAREVSADLPPGPRPSLADVVVEPRAPVDVPPVPLPAPVLAPKVVPNALSAEVAGQQEMYCEDGGCSALAPAQYGGDASVGPEPFAPASCSGVPGPTEDQPLRGAALPALFLVLGLGAVTARRKGR